MKWWEYIDALQKAFPGFIESLSPEDLDRIRQLARKGAAEDWRLREFRDRVQKTPIFTTWQNPTEEEPPLGEEVPPEEVVPPGPGNFPTEPDDRDDIRDLLVNFLNDNELPSTLIGFITDALGNDKSYAQIIAELRQTSEYKAAYPENDLRRTNGFDWMPEAQIRAYRSEAKRIAQTVLGITITNDDVSKLLVNNKSLAEWERTLQTWEDFERWGPTVRAVLESEIGHAIPDDRVFAFLAPFIPTPELDRAYENALYRARPAILGLGIRPDEEAEILRRYGISVEQAFRGYQGIVAEMPAAERFAAIEGEINANVGQFPTGTELFANTPFALLFRGIQLGDAEAMRTLQQQLAREVARFQAGGGAAQGGLGLLAPEERARL